MNEIIRSIESAQLRTDIPKFNVGYTVRVFVKVVEGTRERLQAFEGVVIARRNGSVRETFTVRRTSTAWVSSVLSRCIPPAWITSWWCVVVRSAAQSCTICAISAARLPR